MQDNSYGIYYVKIGDTLMRKGWRGIITFIILTLLGGCTGENKVSMNDNLTMKNTGGNSQGFKEEAYAASTSPFEKYPELVTYTLGKMSGLNNSNMPSGDTYEDNAYTRYLREQINIQNQNVFEVDGKDYQEVINVAVAAKNLPDIMIVEGLDVLDRLVEQDLIADLTTAYEQCASDRIKDIYKSYGDSIMDIVTYDGKMMALPETNISDGPNMLWLRKDWMDTLGLEEPKTIKDAEYIIQQFIEKDPGGNGPGKTIGLASTAELSGEWGYDYEYQLDIIFTSYDVFPKQWVEGEDGRIVYGSVQPEAKEALGHIRQLYQEKLLDNQFLIRTADNIIDLVVSGECGSFFGPWWAPNNPLMSSLQNQPDAVWKPYLLETDEDGVTSFVVQNPTTKFVVVRKGYDHPELIMKLVSVLFDQARYQDKNNVELADYYKKNVDPTARPLAINVDYYDALDRCYKNLRKALEGEKPVEELELLEQSYYELCKEYLENPEEAGVEGWAAYATRIEACELLSKTPTKKIRGYYFGNTATMDKVWWKMKELEKQAYLEIVTGVKPLDYFDEFVKEWNGLGGTEIVKEVNGDGV